MNTEAKNIRNENSKIESNVSDWNMFLVFKLPVSSKLKTAYKYGKIDMICKKICAIVGR